MLSGPAARRGCRHHRRVGSDACHRFGLRRGPGPQRPGEARPQQRRSGGRRVTALLRRRPVRRRARALGGRPLGHAVGTAIGGDANDHRQRQQHHRRAQRAQRNVDEPMSQSLSHVSGSVAAWAAPGQARGGTHLSTATESAAGQRPSAADVSAAARRRAGPRWPPRKASTVASFSSSPCAEETMPRFPSGRRRG